MQSIVKTTAATHGSGSRSPQHTAPFTAVLKNASALSNVQTSEYLRIGQSLMPRCSSRHVVATVPWIFEQMNCEHQSCRILKARVFSGLGAFVRIGPCHVKASRQACPDSYCAADRSSREIRFRTRWFEFVLLPIGDGALVVLGRDAGRPLASTDHAGRSRLRTK
jgi:hypothetical protein